MSKPCFHGFEISPTDFSAGFVRGRPFGGVAILCRDSVFCKSHIIYTDNTWSVALQCFNNWNDKFTVINVYMPCDSYENVDNYSECLGYLSALISDIEGKYVIVGDFNCDSRSTSPCSSLLVGFCTDEKLDLADKCLPDSSFTYVSDVWHTSSWIDHCLVSQSARSLVNNFAIIHSTSSSDHFPLTFDVLFDLVDSTPFIDQPICKKLTKVRFNELSEAMLKNYTDTVCKYVSAIKLSDFDVVSNLFIVIILIAAHLNMLSRLILCITYSMFV